jgi:hypothetical protein
MATGGVLANEGAIEVIDQVRCAPVRWVSIVLMNAASMAATMMPFSPEGKKMSIICGKAVSDQRCGNGDDGQNADQNPCQGRKM